MIKFLSELTGMNVLLFQEHAVLGPVKSAIFSPQNGAILGFFVYDPINKKERVILSQSVKRVTHDAVLVDGYDALSDPSEIERLKEVVGENSGIIKCKVYTESGQYLGRVTNATIDTQALRLQRLYVTPPLGMGLVSGDLLIPAKKIAAITKKKIYVADTKSKTKVPAIVPKPVLD